MRNRCVGALGLWILMSATASSADAPPLPTSSEAWINSSPISLEQVKGKAVFLWFFEETCPTVRIDWNNMNKVGEIYDDRPIVFIGVNSGNSRDVVQTYVDRVQVKWPVIVDINREFEEACKVSKISLENISQFGYVTSDGKFEMGRWNAFKETAEDALKGAAWKVDPSEIPKPLYATWRAIEFGDFKGSGPILKKLSASSKQDLSTAARKLTSILNEAMATETATVKTMMNDGHEWLAYEHSEQIFDQFQGAVILTEFNDVRKELMKLPNVKSGIKSRKLVDGAMKRLQSGEAISKKAISKVISEFPDSKLAEDAQKVIDSVGAPSE